MAIIMIVKCIFIVYSNFNILLINILIFLHYEFYISFIRIFKKYYLICISGFKLVIIMIIWMIFFINFFVLVLIFMIGIIIEIRISKNSLDEYAI